MDHVRSCVVGDHSFSRTAEATSDGVGVPRIGDLIAGKYRVEGILGRGGMGVVLAARHVHLDQTVAVKVLDLSLDDERREEWIARFFHEGRIAAGLRSEHIAQVHDLGLLEDRGVPYMVMELLDGADLAAMLGWHSQLSVEHAVECVRQAASAIALAHRRGIVHRDLKPSNLFVTKRPDGSGLIKVLDFGISKSLDQPDENGSLTSSRAVLGSPFYMSPEQIRDAKRVDHRTDIWSLGAILHELLSGSPPFEADTLPAACAAIVADEPPSIRKLRDDVPEALERVVLRCLEKNPADRYNFAADLVVALQPFSAAARGHSPPRFDTRPSLLEVAARAATPKDPDSPSEDPSTSTLRAAVHEAHMPLFESQVSGEGDGQATEPTGSTPAESVDAVSVTLASEQSTKPFEHANTEPESTKEGGDPAQVDQSTARATRGRVVGLGLAVAAGAGLVIWWTRSHDDLASTPTGVASAMYDEPHAASSFSLLVESSPSGAEVYENNERLGTTPLSLKITNDSVVRRSRVFELRREGYETYYFDQGASVQDATHLAKLIALPAPSASAPAPSTASPADTARAAPAVRNPPKRKNEGPAPAKVEPPDIRMSR